MKSCSISCVLKSLPPHMRVEASQRAIQINSTNRPRVPKGSVLPPESIAMLTDKYWGAGGVHLGVKFLDTSNNQLKAKILSYANKWGQYGNIQFSESSQGEVRIATTPGDGYWSYLGTDIHSIDPSSPTMNLDSFSLATPDSEYDRVVCHEFGHTLGCPHEHARQEILDLLDRDKTYIYFWNHYGWDKNTVDQQVFTALDPSSIWATRPDATSIMCYQFTGECTKSGQPIPGGLVIDELDGQFIGEKYPGAINPDSGNGTVDHCSPKDLNIGLTSTQKSTIIRLSNEIHWARSTHVMCGGAGGIGQAQTPPGRSYDQILTGWHPLMRQAMGNDTPPKPPPPPPLPTQIGPFNSGAISFDGGVPVGGWAQLALFQNGGYSFSGHFHDSGAPSYNINFVWAIVSKSGVLYTFVHNGHMAGTFESGSRDSDWNQQGSNAAIAGGWADLAAGYHWRWEAHVNWDVAAAIESIKQAISAIQQIVQVITIVLA